MRGRATSVAQAHRGIRLDAGRGAAAHVPGCANAQPAAECCGCARSSKQEKRLQERSCAWWLVEGGP